MAKCQVCRRSGLSVGRFVLCARCKRQLSVHDGYLTRRRIKRSHLQATVGYGLRKLLSPVQEEVYFPWAVNPDTGAMLPFDFFLPSLQMVIEVQGIEHYEFVSAFHSKLSDLHYRIHLDNLKKDLAIKNGYHYCEVDGRHLEHEWQFVEEFRRILDDLGRSVSARKKRGS